jgi:hypothetical protein
MAYCLIVIDGILYVRLKMSILPIEVDVELLDIFGLAMVILLAVGFAILITTPKNK